MIEKGKKVKFHYTLTVEGQVVDSSSGKDPLEYEHGGQTIIAGLQKEMEGLNAGDKKQVTVEAKEAYGEINPEAIVEVAKENLGTEDIQQGMAVRAQSQTGQTFQGVVKEVKDKVAIVDFNHPLAGKELAFNIEIVAVS